MKQSAWRRADLGLEVREGRVPVVVYAPHGARRTRPIRRGDGVNDLYTAEIARELADALGAYALVNDVIDRNDADLNRVSALHTSAEPALALLRVLIEQACGDGAVPLILIVHGWNVTMPSCDIGVGLTTRKGDVRGNHPTVSRATLDRFLDSFASDLRAAGIEAPFGLRYPASGRDNATQLFSGRHAEHTHDAVRALSVLAAAGGVDAVQLELAIPLRWVGVYRERFLGVLVAAVHREIEARMPAARRETAANGVSLVTTPHARAARSEWAAFAPNGSKALRTEASAAKGRKLPPGWSLQAVLPDGSGLFGGAEPVGAAEAAGRLCIVRTDGRMLLFVGEDEWPGDEHQFRIGGLRVEASAASDAPEPEGRDQHARGSADGAAAPSRTLRSGTIVRLTYDGPMVIYPSHDAFCDLETGLAGSKLAHGAAALRFEAVNDGFGRLSGTIACDDERFDVNVLAVCERGSRRSGDVRARSRVFVTHGPAGPLALRADFDGCEDGERASCDCRIDREGEIAEIGCFFADGSSSDARVLTRVPVYRVGRDQLVVKVTFGTAALSGNGDEGLSLALFEHVELMER